LTGTIPKAGFLFAPTVAGHPSRLLVYADSQPICVSAWYQRTYVARAARRRKPLQRKDLQLFWLFLVFPKDKG